MDRASLPEPVRRYVDAAFAASLPAIETMELRGRGRVHIGPLPWLPIDARMYHRLGHDYVGLIRVRVAGLTVLPVIDAYVDDRGITKIGPAPSIGPEIDQGAFLGMWPLPAAYPSAWTGGVAWEAVDDQTARLHLPFDDAVQTATIRFDPASGYPIRFEADRYKGTTGRKVRWFGDSSGWRRVSGIPVPGLITAWWSDDPGPWFELRVEEARPNASIEEALDKGRRAIADARRRKERVKR